MSWPHKTFGLVVDPVHKSHLNELTGEYGCPRRFKYQRDAEADGGGQREHAGMVNAHLACGTAAHETIARALNQPRARDHLLLVDGAHMPELDTLYKLQKRVRATFEHELRVAADGRQIDWGKEDAEDMVRERVDMVTGVLGSLCRYARRVLAVEPGFIVELEGVWYSGHIDLVYEPRLDGDVRALLADVTRALPANTNDGAPAVGIADWKSGKQKPDAIELAHGWEAGIYSLACQRGVFLPRECVALERADDGSQWIGSVTFQNGHVYCVRPTRWQAERDTLEAALKHLASVPGATHADAFGFNTYPSRVYHVHMRDYVPYEKSGSKEAKRPEDLAHYGLTQPGRVKYVAGDLRGPAWLPVELHENDVARLAYRARNVIGTVRMGRFVDLVREHCRRCPFSRECLTGGYSLRGDELAALESTLKQAGL